MAPLIAACLLLLALCGPVPLQAASVPDASDETKELWTGSLYTSTYRVGLCFSPKGTLRGVVHLRLMSGQVDVYHINGTVKDGRVTASHSSGHSFTGRLVAPDRVKGRIVLKSGRKIDLEGTRHRGVSLAPEDCAPLDDGERK
ncbi:MAG: hypothetical protein LBR22_07480 [Desulfovibrio sp.]|nr:hypothetical protein [Desulfovibrio sp.]